MDIFRDSEFGDRFDLPPVLKTTEKLHVGLEVRRTENIKRFFSKIPMFFRKIFSKKFKCSAKS